ncbi:hypothetical protein [Pseudonocardia sp. DLS-67]
MHSDGRLLVAAVLILVVGAAVLGFAVHDRHVERAEAGGAALWPTSAVLVEESGRSGLYGAWLPVQVDARWTDRAGIRHTGAVTVDVPVAAGAVVEIWIDAGGGVVEPPVPPRNAGLAGVAAACAVLALGGSLLYALAYAARSLTDRR